MGRTKQNQLSDPGGTDFSDTSYDANGRVAIVSNPYRSTSDPTYGNTQTQYDRLGRVKLITKQDGSPVSTSYGTACSGTNLFGTTVTDEQGHTRTSCTDAVGRLIQIFENPGGLNYETDYQYDALGNLLTVNQKGSAPTDNTQWRTRTFTYDSLSRLLCAANPEITPVGTVCPTPDNGTYTAGTIRYSYDADGNLITKIAPLPNQTNPSVTVTTTYQYDALNRLIQKSYSDGTPTATFYYDVAPSAWASGEANTTGRLVEATTGHTPAP